MKHIIYILLFLNSFNGVAQEFADKEFYLVDSLVLEELSEGDKELLRSSLEKYHSAKDDTTKINALNDICENMMSENWKDFQFFQYDIIKKLIKKGGGSNLNLFKSSANALNNIGIIYEQNGDLNKALINFKKSLDASNKIKDKAGIASTLNNMGGLYRAQGNSPMAIKSLHQALNIFKEIDDKKGVATAYNQIGGIYDKQGNLDEAVKYFIKSSKIRIKIGDVHGVANSLNNIGFMYKRYGNIPKALEYYHKSLKIREKAKDERGITECLNNIGGVYSRQGDMPKALEYYNKSLQISRNNGDKTKIAHTYDLIGLIYRKNNLTKALELHKKALKLYEEIGYKHGVANAINNIGDIYYVQGDNPKALKYYHEALSIQEEIGDISGISTSLINIGSIETENNNLKEALNYTLRAYNIAKQMRTPFEIKHSSASLSNIYEKQGEGMKALEMYKFYIQMKDSINNEATQKATIRQQTQYEYEKQKAIDDAGNDKKVALEKEKQKKQFIVLVIIIIASCLVLLLLLIIYRRLRITKKQKVIIEEQKDIVELAHKETQEQKEVIEEAHKEITDSINYAERIQRSFLATEDLLNKNLDDYFVFFQPKEAVSGDFYWADKLPNGQFAMVNADSTGHGVPGAIMSILNISSIEKAVEKGLTSTSDIFNDTRKTIIERLKKDGSVEGGKDGMDASIIAFDQENNKFTYTAAQNPIWVIRDKEVIQLKAEKMPIGKHDNDATPFVGGEFETKKGDIVYTLTDGYQDQFGGPKGKKFMVKKMREYILSISHLPMQEQHVAIKDTFNSWKGDLEQIDDVCVIGVRI